MESRSVGFSLAGVAGVGAILAALSATQTARSAPTVINSTAAASEHGELVHRRVGSTDSVRATYRHGITLLEEYSRRRVACPATGVTACGARGQANRPSLQVIIASIPDPYDSHLDWAYDAYLEAFRRAMAAGGYVPDRYWMPAASDSLEIIVDGEQPRDTAHVALHEFYPGVMLFRSADPRQQKLALLYLISELPTTGEHKEAFLAAVRERRLLMRDTASFRVDPGVRDTLLIAGPIFSGAAQSLRGAIDDGLRVVDRDIRAVRIVTGSATNTRNQTALSGPTDAVPLFFQATLNSDAAMDSVLATTLQSLGLRRDQVAVLTESSTQYGVRDTSSGYLTITFPLNIASLRNEVGDGATDAGDGAAIPGLSQTARTRLELRDKTRPRETPQVISALTVPTLELVLGEIVQTLADHDIRAVVIQATDIRDQLLLAREIRSRNRDAQVITFQGHRLLLRPEYARQLDGTLVLTSYPLFLENQWWVSNGNTDGPRQLLSLSNDAAVGTFNTMLTLLRLPDSRIEYDSPVADSAGPVTPPVWLTAVTHGAFLPITITSPAERFQSYFGSDSATRHATRGTFEPADRTNLTTRLAVTLLGLAVLLGCAVVLGTRRPIVPARRIPADQLDISYRRIEAHSLLIHERIYATLLVIALHGMFIPLGATLLLIHAGAITRLWVWAVASVALMTVATGISDVLRLVARSTPEGTRYAFFSLQWREGSRADLASTQVIRSLFPSGRLAQLRWWGEIVGRALVALIGVTHFALTLLYVVQLRHLAIDDRPRFLLFAFRALRTFSGLSPLLPLLLCGAGFALWSAWQWRVTHRLYVATTATEEVALVHARSARIRTMNDPLSRAAGFVDAARASLFRIHPTGGGFVLTALLLILAGIITLQHVGSVERLVLSSTPLRWSFDALFWIGAFSMLVTGAWALYRITATWRALQSALAALGETPLVNAFGRLPRHVARLTRLNIFADSEHAATRQTISERWRELRRQVADLDREIHAPGAPQLGASDREASIALRSIVRRHGSDREFATLEKTYRMKHVRRTACALRAAWRASDTVPAIEGTVPREQRPPMKSISAAMRTAEEFLAIECVRYIESILHDLRLLASFLLVTLLLSVALLSSYPFQPQGIVKLSFIGLLLATVTVLFLVMTQMSRDDVLSAITRTDPGKVSWDTTLVLNLTLFGAIPLLTLVSAEFPGVRMFLFSWAEPLVRSVVKS